MINKITQEELEDKCLELLSKTFIELGQHNIDAESKVILAKSLAEDLDKKFNNFYWEDVVESFRAGVREPNKDFIHINVPTYMRWLYNHRQLIWDDIYRAETLGHDKDSLPYYREKKLLK
nr:hypothetical protein [Nanoarchaeota archaeon]